MAKDLGEEDIVGLVRVMTIILVRKVTCPPRGPTDDYWRSPAQTIQLINYMNKHANIHTISAMIVPLVAARNVRGYPLAVTAQLEASQGELTVLH